MTKLTIILLVLGIFLVTFATNANADILKIGQEAPHFVAEDTQGKQHNIADYKGKIVVLEWKNHQCPYVRRHYSSGNMQKLQEYMTGKGAVWLSIISSAPGKQGHVSAEEANDIIKSQNSHATAVILDPEGIIGNMYQAKTTPHMFVINTEGMIAYMGAIDSDPYGDVEDISQVRNYVKETLDALIANEEVNVTATKPYGCSVKY